MLCDYGDEQGVNNRELSTIPYLHLYTHRNCELKILTLFPETVSRALEDV